jgi:hypothetical protein
MTLQERFDHLLGNYERLLEVHAHVQMDNPEDKALHARAIEVFTTVLQQVR